MATWKSIEERLRGDGKALHDYLWRPGWTGDADRLFADLAAEARDLDAHLGAGGKLSRHAAALAKSARAGAKDGSGESLFELLSHSYDLTAATEHVRRGDHAGAAEHLEGVMGSVTIGVCANAGCFALVQEWESGKIPFEAYMGKLADHLAAKGIATAGEWKRLVSAGYCLRRTLGEDASEEENGLAARAAIACACWATLASVSIRRSLGTPPRFPYDDFAAVVTRIAARV